MLDSDLWVASWTEEFGKLKLKMIPKPSTCFELFLELYSRRVSPLAMDILFLFSCHGLSKGLRTGVNEDVG